MEPIVLRGFSDASGSWKIIWRSRRYGRISEAEKSETSSPR